MFLQGRGIAHTRETLTFPNISGIVPEECRQISGEDPEAIRQTAASATVTVTLVSDSLRDARCDAHVRAISDLPEPAFSGIAT